MKKLISIFLFVIIFHVISFAQTINPSCYSNAKGWKITRIENDAYSTLVYIECYTYESNYTFFINSGMYIEQYNTSGSARYYIKSFDDNQLDTKYSISPFTTNQFILRFQRIPDYWTDINIVEPYTSGYNAWYWKYITLNASSTQRLKIENFLNNSIINFCETFAHPMNTLRKYTYAIEKDRIYLTLYYNSGYVTDLSFRLSGNLITNTTIVYDNDAFNPFSVLSLLRNWIVNNDSNQQYTTLIEQKLDKVIREMTGLELTSVALTILWNS